MHTTRYGVHIEENKQLPAAKSSRGLGQMLKEELITKRFNSPLGYGVLVLVGVFFALLVGYLKFLGAAMVMALSVGIPVLFFSVYNLRAGVLIAITITFFILGIIRYVSDLPLGLVLDVFLALMFIGLLVKLADGKRLPGFYQPLSYLVLGWIVFNLIQVANPWAASRLAWLYTIRSVAGILLLYFIVLYAANTLTFVSTFLKLWIGLALIGCLYGLKQEFFGFSTFEHNWVLADEERFSLIFNWGKFRRFSFFSDPTVFGVLMSYTSLLCFVLATDVLAYWKRAVLVGVGLLMVLAMIYSGTRTAYAMLPVGMVFFAVLTLRTKVLALVGLFFLFGMGIVFSPIYSLGPLDSNNLNRIRSAFKADDASFQVRMRNQEYIQPYIWTHPLGGGLGSIGIWGRRFSPNSPLSQFPPDSGFVRVAVEQGYIGLILYCSMLFVMFYQGIKNYTRSKHPKIRLYYLALLTVLYSLVVANYPQQSFAIYPTIAVFIVCMALIIRLKYIEETLTNNADEAK